MKKLLYLFMCVCLCVMATVAVSAEIYSGECGEAVTWMLDTESGEIVISGSGDMTDFASRSDTPWYEHRTYIKKVTVANGVTSVGDYAFDWVYKNLSEVVLADSVKTVNYSAFSELTSLTDVDLGQGIESIGNYSFQHTSIEKLSVPASAKIIGSCAFRGCSNLADLAFAEGIEIIDDFAFDSCTSLKTVTIPDSVTELVHGAFCGCTSLEEVIIGNGVTHFSGQVFSYCEKLEKVTVGNSLKYITYYDFGYCTSLREIVLPDSLLGIDADAFGGSYNLEKVTISPYTMFIYDSAFEDCENLTIYGYEPSFAKDYAEKNGYAFVSLGASPFVDCGVVGENVYWILNYDGTININGVGVIKEYSSSKDYPWKAYSGEIKSVEIGDGITTIPFGAFFFYTGIESIKIADTVREIGSHAFYWAGISTLEIPKSVIEIGEGAFGHCANLTSVTIGREVEIIGEGAFENCAEGFTIYGYKGTAAETYALLEGIPFVALEAAEDVDGDGVVSVSDVLTVLNAMLGGSAAEAYDISGNGKVDLIDVLRVLKIAII